MLDNELIELASILKQNDVTKDRYLVSIKGGWINLTIDGNSVLEFNKKKNFIFNDKAQQVEEINYKLKSNGKIVKSISWVEIKTKFQSEVASFKSNIK